MTVTVKHSKTNAISDWTQAQLDEQISLGNFPAGTTLANIVLPSDWNNDHTLTGVGTMAEQNANNVSITGGSVNGTTIGATTASTGKFTSVTTPSVTASSTDLTLSAISTGNINFNTLNGTQLKVKDGGASTVNYLTVFGGGTGTGITYQPEGTDSNITLDYITKGTGVFRFATGSFSQRQFHIAHTASAVNYVQVTGSATTVQPVISAQGSDSAIGLVLTSKGGNNVLFRSNNNANTQFTVNGANASVNNLQVAGSLTGSSPILSSIGSDTNISMAFQPKGTGAIDLAAGSSGVNISNGGTVTALTRTAGGSGYTTALTATISAPTTAGGVQATANAYAGAITTVITSGGTGYTLNDVITVVGGTGIQSQSYTVTGVTAGVITALTVQNYGQYTALPSSPVSTTGGTGTGASLTLSNWSLTAIAIATAGSGYIEQPTVTITGGGGSGAAAYATVGSGTTIKNLGNITTFATPNSNVLAIVDKNAAGNNPTNTNVAFAMVPQQSGFGASYLGFGSQAYLGTSNATSAAFIFATSVSSPVSNGGGGSTQLQLAHTSAAVNYVQVTGGATGSGPIISTQGSDTNATLTLRSKGTFAVTMQSSAGANIFEAIPTASSVNYLRVAPSIASSAPTLSAQGTDTNIDLALTPKGTGLVRFGTYTANMALTVQGYIEIKDSGGTLRKLAVIA